MIIPSPLLSHPVAQNYGSPIVFLTPVLCQNLIQWNCRCFMAMFPGILAQPTGYGYPIFGNGQLWFSPANPGMINYSQHACIAGAPWMQSFHNLLPI